MRFNDLFEAGCALAPALERYRGERDVLVLGVAFGGVPVALEVAKYLRKPLDVLFIRRLVLKDEKQPAAAAISVCGKLFLEEGVPANFHEGMSAQDRFINTELEEFARTVRACRGNRPLRDLSGIKVLLVDNGIRTGSTMTSAVRAVRDLRASKVVAAVPVADAQTRSSIDRIADELICLEFLEPFGHVGMFYRKFLRPGEADIARMLNEAELSTP